MPDENQALEPINSFFGSMGERTVDKIAGALGMMFPYAGLEKLAVDTYVDSIKAGDFTPEEKYMLISGAKNYLKQIKNQHAIAQIAQNTAAEGTDFSVNSKVDDEWLARFMDASKFVSDQDAQYIWGKILAGEFEQPGSTPPRVTRILTELTTRYARVFMNLCALNILITPEDRNGELFPDKAEYHLFIPVNADREYLYKLDISFDTLSELEQIGLIKYSENGFVTDSFYPTMFPRVQLSYAGETFMHKNISAEGINVGSVLFTDAGLCIAKFISTSHIVGHLRATKIALSLPK